MAHLRELGRGLAGSLFTLALVLLPAAACAQDLEPRAYSNAPVGFNCLIPGCARSQGGLSFDPSLPIEDARLRTDTGVRACARAGPVGQVGPGRQFTFFGMAWQYR